MPLSSPQEFGKLGIDREQQHYRHPLYQEEGFQPSPFKSTKRGLHTHTHSPARTLQSVGLQRVSSEQGVGILKVRHKNFSTLSTILQLSAFWKLTTINYNYRLKCKKWWHTLLSTEIGLCWFQGSASWDQQACTYIDENRALPTLGSKTRISEQSSARDSAFLVIHILHIQEE